MKHDHECEGSTGFCRCASRAEIACLTKQNEMLVAALKKLEAIAGTGSNAKEIAQQALAAVKAPPPSAEDAKEGWKEATIAWSVCASIHREWAKGKDAFYTTRQGDFTKHENEARAKYMAIDATALSLAKNDSNNDPNNDTIAIRSASVPGDIAIYAGQSPKQTIKVKTSDLIGPALDWAVAKCEEDAAYRLELREFGHDGKRPFMRDISLSSAGGGWWPHYSTNWSQGGLIIDRERIQFYSELRTRYRAYIGRFEAESVGSTHLIAAMRCYVAFKLGIIVDVPKELQ